MAKSEKANINKIFDDLDKYLWFCKDFGYKFNEMDLYNNKSYVYRQYSKFESGKEVKDMWAIDAGKTT